jgi:outer membrane protein, multidrug efflux system
VTRRVSAVAAAAMVCVACVGLPSKPKPVQLPNATPLEGFESAGGGEWPAADWWKRYQDPTLDQLIQQATDSSPTLATAHARYDSARQSVRLAGAASGARVDASAAIDRQRLSDNGLVPPQLLGFHWYNQADLGLQVSYTFDWWGKERDSVEAAIDQARAAQADRSAAARTEFVDPRAGYSSDRTTLTEESAAYSSIYPMPQRSAATNFFTSAEDARIVGGMPLPEKTNRDQIARICASDLPATFRRSRLIAGWVLLVAVLVLTVIWGSP